MYFTQSPIEASIWTAFVALQQWITSEILLTPIFKGAVFTWLSFSFGCGSFLTTSFDDA